MTTSTQNAYYSEIINTHAQDDTQYVNVPDKPYNWSERLMLRFLGMCLGRQLI